jgi:uncharacterized protein (PEP-CTERM system associated)
MESRRRRLTIKPATLAGAIAAFMALACAPLALALDWRIQPTLEGSAIYTDNANQGEDDPDGSLILRATPGFTLLSEGSRRVQATLQYGLTGVTRFDADDNTDLLHKLNAVGKAELVEDFLFIDGSAHISQELISLEGALVEAEISDNNRATVGTYSVSPYIQKRLGTFANAEARYSASGAIFENDAAANSSVNSYSAALTSGTRFADLSWGLDYFYREAMNRDYADSVFERASATLGYALTRTFRIFGTVGEEWNDYLSVTETDGSFYSAGFGWSPSRRTSIEVAAGERYFGNTWDVSVRHRTRTSNWNVSYVEGLNDITEFLLTTGTVYDYLCPGPDGTLLFISDWLFSFPPAPGCIAFGGTPGLVTDLRNGVFVSSVLRAGVSWGTGKLSYSLEAFDSLREYQVSASEDRTQGVTAGMTYRMAPKTSVRGSLDLTRYETSSSIPGRIFAARPNTQDREDDIYRLNLGVDHQFDPDFSGTLTYQYQQRDSNIVNGDFTENRITATANMSF